MCQRKLKIQDANPLSAYPPPIGFLAPPHTTPPASVPPPPHSHLLKLGGGRQLPPVSHSR